MFNKKYDQLIEVMQKLIKDAYENSSSPTLSFLDQVKKIIKNNNDILEELRQKNDLLYKLEKDYEGKRK